MKVVILAGGYGTRISEESGVKPKPMVEIGGKPILWHIMKEYSYYGHNDFIICCGYKQHVIKEWFANYYLYNSDVTFDFANNNAMQVHNNVAEPWKVTLVDTGLDTMTGGRIKRVQRFVGNEPFMLTYGDGVSDVDINALVAFHKNNGKLLTLTAVNVEQQFGVMKLDQKGGITAFHEKKATDGGTINAGYMVLEPAVFDYLEGDSTIFEKAPIETLVSEGKADAYLHTGFWKCMDTQRDRIQLESLIAQGKAPWMVWQ